MSERAQGDGFRRLDLGIEPFTPDDVNEFEVIILLDGEELLADRRLEISDGVGFVGFDPWDILGTDPCWRPRCLHMTRHRSLCTSRQASMDTAVLSRS